MSKQFPAEFKRDVAEYARRTDATHQQVADAFGISINSVKRWIKQAAIDDGHAEGLSSAEKVELAELKRKTRQLEMENEILRRAAAYFAKDALPK